MPLNEIRKKLQKKPNLSPSFGSITKIMPNVVVASGIRPSVGDIVEFSSGEFIESSPHSKDKNYTKETLGMVSAVEQECFYINPFSFVEGLKSGDRVKVINAGLQIPVGEELLGRIINPLGTPIDNKGNIKTTHTTPLMREPIGAMRRGVIDEVFSVGIKSIDGLLTCGKGQKMGIFAGSGVGKSTLIGMIVNGAKTQIKVIALIGERGREVPEFVKRNLNDDLHNTIIVVATSDDSPLMRKYGAFSAMVIAEYFKSQGADVLFIMDSITRFAMAQREIGLALGEPPTSKGYPPSVLTMLPQLMERAGKEEGSGSITAFFTILVEGDELSDDPIADQSRSILDGHIVLSRELTDFGIYPPINILNSTSRVITDIAQSPHLQAVQKFRRLHSLLKQNEALIRIGAYQRGSDRELDEAIDKKPLMDEFLAQEIKESWEFDKTLEQLQIIMSEQS